MMDQGGFVVVDTVEQLTGHPARALEQWAAEHAERFYTPDAAARCRS